MKKVDRDYLTYCIIHGVEIVLFLFVVCMFVFRDSTEEIVDTCRASILPSVANLQTNIVMLSSNVYYVLTRQSSAPFGSSCASVSPDSNTNGVNRKSIVLDADEKFRSLEFGIFNSPDIKMISLRGHYYTVGDLTPFGLLQSIGDHFAVFDGKVFFSAFPDAPKVKRLDSSSLIAKSGGSE